jgi:predicted dehydrogenase
MKNQPSTVSRRAVLGAAAAAAAYTIVPRHVLGGPKFVPPSEKVHVAMVGVGGQGRSNLRGLFEEADAQVIAVADPIDSFNLDAFYYKGMAGRLPVQAEIEKHYAEKGTKTRCAAYVDFREMLDKEKAIDAILCATPDHLHAYVSVTAMRAGKHVYCEKPLTHNLWEARKVAEVARETGVATQLGNQGHSRDGIRQTCEWIWDGAIGPVREVHAWVNAGRWNKTLTGLPTDSVPTPPGVNWDLWIGPRQPRAYHPAYTPVTWRDFWAFGTGAQGDFGCHDLDAATWALKLGSPTVVEAKPAGNMDQEIAPHGELCYFQFGPRGDQPPVRANWYTGGLMPPCPEELGEKQALPDRGVLFVGDKGLMLCEGAGGPPRLLPLEKTRAYKKPPQSLPRSKGHHYDWLQACKGGPQASSNFEYGAKLTEIVLLGVLSLRARKRIYWDGVNLKAKNLPELDPLIRGDYRKGWEIV